jgi:hypothetical protein
MYIYIYLINLYLTFWYGSPTYQSIQGWWLSPRERARKRHCSSLLAGHSLEQTWRPEVGPCVFFPHRFTQTWMGNTWKKHGETLWLLITNDYYMLLLENHQDLLFCWVWTLDPFISNVVLIYVQRTMTGSSELIRTDLSVFKGTNLSGNVSTSYSIVRFLDLLRDLSRVL